MSVQPVTISIENQQLRGKLYRPEGDPKSIAVLFLHGWTGTPNDPAAAVLAAQGYYAMTFSMRGHNDSDGDITKISRQDSLNDALAAYDYFTEQLPESTKIVLVGNSYGSYISALTSLERPVVGLSLRVPAPYPDEDFNGPHKGHHDAAVMNWRRQVHDYNHNRGFKAVHTFTGPIQIIEAELDDLVPHESVQNYMRAMSEPAKLDYHLMEGWPHSLGSDPRRVADFQRILLTWLQQIENKVY